MGLGQCKRRGTLVDTGTIAIDQIDIGDFNKVHFRLAVGTGWRYLTILSFAAGKYDELNTSSAFGTVGSLYPCATISMPRCSRALSTSPKPSFSTFGVTIQHSIASFSRSRSMLASRSGSYFKVIWTAISGSLTMSCTPLIVARIKPFTASGCSLRKVGDAATPLP